MAFSGALISPMAVASGVFNDVNGSLQTPFAVVSGTVYSAMVFNGALVAPFAVLEGTFNEAFNGALITPMSEFLQGGFDSATLFSGALKTPFAVASGEIGSAWVGKLISPMAVLSGVFVGSSYSFNGALVTPMAVINGLIAIPVSDNFSVLVMNLSNKLLSFYENYNFNSACLFNGEYIAAGADGLYLLIGPDDNGAQIDASILLGNYDFGIDQLKTNPEIYVNYSGNGEAQVSVNVDQDEDFDGPYQVPAPTGNKLQTRRAKPALGLRGSHWQYLIENVEGSQINIQNLELKFKKSQRRLH